MRPKFCSAPYMCTHLFADPCAPLTHARTHTPAGPVHSCTTCHGLHAMGCGAHVTPVASHSTRCITLGPDPTPTAVCPLRPHGSVHSHATRPPGPVVHCHAMLAFGPHVASCLGLAPPASVAPALPLSHATPLAPVPPLSLMQHPATCLSRCTSLGPSTGSAAASAPRPWTTTCQGLSSTPPVQWRPTSSTSVPGEWG